MMGRELLHMYLKETGVKFYAAIHYEIVFLVACISLVLLFPVERTQNDFTNRRCINCNKIDVYLSGWKW